MIDQETLLLNPFPGLRAFRTQESDYFFGRDGQSDQVLTKLRTARFVAVVGTSGSGKSSLVSAGLLPALFSGHMPSAGSSWRIANFRPGSSPISNLARALSDPAVCGTKDQETAGDRFENIERTLRRSSLGLLEVVSQSKLAAGENLLVLVDQFEELFRFRKKSTAEHPEDEAAAFVKLLLETKQADKSPEEKLAIYVILTMRSDYLGDCAHFWGLPEAINEGQFLIPRMTDDNRREAITGPVIMGGGEITATLVNRLLNDAGDDPAQLPILQHALMRTWDYWKNRCNAVGSIDIPHYEKIGGMAAALSNHADEAYLDLAPDLQEVAGKVFKSLTEKEADNREGRRPATVGEIAAAALASEPQITTVIESFRREDRSFLMPSPPAALTSDTLIDISHESLIRGWVRLRAWVDEEAEAARQYIRLADTAALFPEKESFLRDPALSNGLKWLEDNRPTKAWARRYHPGFYKTIEYLELSKANRQAEIDEKERQHKEEIERDLLHAHALAAGEMKRVKLRNWGLVILSLLLIGMLGVTVYAVRQKNYAERQQTEADKQRERAEKALNDVKVQRDTATHAKREAEEQRGRAEGALVTAEEEGRKAEKQAHIAQQATRDAERQKLVAVNALGTAKSAAAEAQESEIAALKAKAEAEKAKSAAEKALATIKEIDLSPPYTKAVMRGHEKAIKSVALSPDGRYLVTASNERSVRLFDANSNDDAMPPWAFGKLRTSVLTSATFSHDGKFIAAASDEGEIGIWDIEKSAGRTFGSAGNSYSSLVLSPDDTLVAAVATAKSVSSKHHATGSGSNPIFVEVRSVSGDKLLTLSGHSGTVNSLVFSRDGRYLVTASADGTARVWDTTSGLTVAEMRGHLSEVNNAEFSPDGKLIVTASDDGTAHVWKALTGEILQQSTLSPEAKEFLKKSSTLSSQAKAALDQGILSPEAGELLDKSTLSAEAKKVVIVKSTLDHPGAVTSARFSPDGKYIVTTSENKAYLWAPESAGKWVNTSTASPTILEGHEDAVSDAKFSPDGRWIVTISQDRTARLWRAEILPYFTGNEKRRPARAISLAVFRGHIKPLTSVQVSNDSKYMVTGSEDRTARVWDLGGVRPFSVVATKLRAEPSEYKGKCPFTIKLTGTISVVGGRGGTVKYKFVRNDGGQTLPQELVFDGPGSKEVSTTREAYFQGVSRAGKPLPLEGWLEIEILAPVAMKSNRAAFSVVCDEPGGQQLAALSDLTDDQLRQIMPNPRADRRALYLPYIQAAMAEFGINTPVRRAQFLAQVAHETAELRYMEEIASGAAYEGRKDMGNTEPGDGKRFKGRGVFQITGRTSYQKYGEQLGVDLIGHPEFTSSPQVAFRLAALIWQTNGLNELADKDNIRAITQRINGGYNGLDDRTRYLERAKSALGVGGRE